MTKPILIINGPNLNMLGVREPEKYGSKTMDDVLGDCLALAKTLSVNVDFFQSNKEGSIIDAIQLARTKNSGIIINAGAFSHTSIAIMDALNDYVDPVIEVHITNIHKREKFRHHSYISTRADGIIVGCGTQGYELAVIRMAQLIK